jgi:hypothetical protein
VLLDVPFQIWSYHRGLRMTKEEVRQESKEMEGDPQIKARIRSLQREAARRRMMQAVPKADVVVTNPMHFAVALKYEEKTMAAPLVVAKGSQLVAERIKELARNTGCPSSRRRRWRARCTATRSGRHHPRRAVHGRGPGAGLCLPAQPVDESGVAGKLGQQCRRSLMSVSLPRRRIAFRGRVATLMADGRSLQGRAACPGRNWPRRSW